MDIRTLVYDQIKTVAEQQGKTIQTLGDNVHLLGSGLDSLCVAIIIASLDDNLKVDAFGSDTVEIPTTMGDLVRIYEHAVTAAPVA